MSDYCIDKEALIEQLEQNRANAVRFLWRLGANNPSLRAEGINKVSLLELAAAELKSGKKEPSEVISYFKELVTDELEALNNSLESTKTPNKKGLPKQPSIKTIYKS